MKYLGPCGAKYCKKESAASKLEVRKEENRCQPSGKKLSVASFHSKSSLEPHRDQEKEGIWAVKNLELRITTWRPKVND